MGRLLLEILKSEIEVECELNEAGLLRLVRVMYEFQRLERGADIKSSPFLYLILQGTIIAFTNIQSKLRFA